MPYVDRCGRCHIGYNVTSGHTVSGNGGGACTIRRQNFLTVLVDSNRKGQTMTEVSTMARISADTLHKAMTKQIADFCRSTAKHGWDQMSAAEAKHFADAADALDAILQMQSK